MEFKNKEIMKIADTLVNLYNKSKAITLKWELANMSTPFIDTKNRIQQEINNIIEAEGVIDEETKVKEIKPNNQHYVELINIVTDIDTILIKLELLSDVDISIEEMMIIKKLIKEDM